MLLNKDPFDIIKVMQHQLVKYTEKQAFFFLLFGMSFATLVYHLRHLYKWIPYTPTIFLISFLLGLGSQHMGLLGESIQYVTTIEPHNILIIFLPPLVFESSFNADWYIFRKQASQIMTLAFPVVFVSALIIMLSLKLVIGYEEEYYNYSEAFMLGSILSCTDMVAVLALLKEAGAPKKFNSLIEGESVFNDGTCMVLFTLSFELVKGQSPSPLRILQLFLELTMGALVLGVIFGFVCTKMFNRVKQDPLLCLNITLVSCYLLFFTAEYIDFGIKISGILAIAAMGLYMAAFGKSKISAQSKEIIEKFWKSYIFIAESVIFILSGAIVGVQGLNAQFLQIVTAKNLFRVLCLYGCLTAARFFSIALFMPKLQSSGYGLKWRQVGALTYGGLRGAIGLCFSLILCADTTLKKKFRLVSLLNTSGCVFATLMINAPTCGYALKKLGICIKTEPKTKFFKNFLKQCDNVLKNKLEDLKKDPRNSGCEWSKVENQSCLPQIKDQINKCRVVLHQQERETVMEKRETEMSNLDKNNLSGNLLNDSISNAYDIYSTNDRSHVSTLAEIRYRFSVLMKGILWEKYEASQCSAQSLKALIECLDIDMDGLESPLNSWDYLISHMHNEYFFSICYWLKSKPLIGKYASQWIYERVVLLYDAVSTYIQALKQCEAACKQLPYDPELQQRVIDESQQNRRLAEYFLEHEVSLPYFEVMKKIQTAKAVHSLLHFQKGVIEKTYKYNQLNEYFHRKMEDHIHEAAHQFEKDADQKIEDQFEVLKRSEFFSKLSMEELKRIFDSKKSVFFQRNQFLFEKYEKNRYVYFILRGNVHEEYKYKNEVVYSESLGVGTLIGVGDILINRKQLQATAIAESLCEIYCFEIADIKELVRKNPVLEEILERQLFMLEINLEKELAKSLGSRAINWRQVKPMAKYRRLGKGEKFDLQNSYVMLIYGQLCISGKNEEAIKKGFIQVNGRAEISGVAKFFYVNHEELSQYLAKREEKATENEVRRSEKRVSEVRASEVDRIMERAIFSKHESA